MINDLTGDEIVKLLTRMQQTAVKEQYINRLCEYPTGLQDDVVAFCTLIYSGRVQVAVDGKLIQFERKTSE